MISLGYLIIYLGRSAKDARSGVTQPGRESGVALSEERSDSPRMPSPAAGGFRGKDAADPPDAGPGDAVLPPGRSTRPGPFRCLYTWLSTVSRLVRSGARAARGSRTQEVLGAQVIAELEGSGWQMLASVVARPRPAAPSPKPGYRRQPDARKREPLD
jgi:hypothetical protein